MIIDDGYVIDLTVDPMQIIACRVVIDTKPLFLELFNQERHFIIYHYYATGLDQMLSS